METFNLIEFENIKSTSEEAKAQAVQGVAPWTTIVANEQSLGHGRKGDYWFSPKGGLYISVILPKTNIDDLQTITILAAFVVAKILKEKYEIEPLIKLPNDILFEEKKLCGILTENIVVGDETVVSVLGIGLNTNIDEFPENLKDTAVSLKNILNKEVDNKEILEQILSGLKSQLETINQ
jgi:BirA family biotin operon repressor/biotin-[acetyl-CoA-carboxylase] ligase